MTESDDPIIRGWKQIEKVVGKSRSQLWRDVQAGLFPAPLDLGANSVGWLRADINSWIASRPRRRYGRPPKDTKRSTPDDSTDSLTIRRVVAGDHRVVRIHRWTHQNKERSGFLRKAA